MAITLGKQQLFSAVHKHYSLSEWQKFAAENAEILPYVAASSGTVEGDFEKLSSILKVYEIFAQLLLKRGSFPPAWLNGSFLDNVIFNCRRSQLSKLSVWTWPMDTQRRSWRLFARFEEHILSTRLW